VYRDFGDVLTPAEMRKPVVFEQGCAQVWPDAKLQEFEKRGDAAAGGSNGKLRIPQHHAHTVQEALDVLEGYRQVANHIGWEFVLRGQSRDYYYPESDKLLALPSIMRPHMMETYMDFLYSNSTYQAAVEPWLRILNKLEVDTSSVPIRVRHPVAVGRGNPVVPAILQHYGFPTDHLDATTDPVVALWFALHASRSDNRGRISFKPLVPVPKVRRTKRPRSRDVADVPTVHVVIQPKFSADNLNESFPLVHLASLDTLIRVAKRPVCQAGASLPCTAAYVDGYYEPGEFSLQVRTIYRWPAAILKLYFSFEALGRTDVTAATLFPSDEVLYRSLLDAKVPYLAIYA